MNQKFAVQLHTVREELKKDFPNVLRELKTMGWSGIEMAGLYDYDPKEIAAVLNETGLKTAGMHVQLNEMVDHLDKVLEEANLFQTKNLVCPYLTDDLRSEEGFRYVKKALNDIAASVTEQGFQVSYHNHDFEFHTKMDNQTALEFLLNPNDNNAIQAEIDVYWVKKGGYDPLTFIKPYAGRMPLIHLKDMTRDKQEDFAEIGTGSIEFRPILNWCENHGVGWYVIEQDTCPGDPMDSLLISIKNITHLISMGS